MKTIPFAKGTFLSVYSHTGVLGWFGVFSRTAFFLWKINFKSKTNAFCKGKKHKTFSAAKYAANIDRIVYIFSIFQRKLNRHSFSVQVCGRDLISALSYVAKYT